MKQISQTFINPAVRLLRCRGKQLMRGLAASTMLFVAAGSTAAPQDPGLSMDAEIGQIVFSTPELAAQTLTDAIAARDSERIKQILGAESMQLLPLDSIEREDVDKYLTMYAQRHVLLADGEQQFVLTVGEDNWTLPIPITKGEGGWYFDTAAGAERVLIREFGRNELATIQAALAYYDAQMEYADQDRNGDGILEYAQKFISSANQHDGLFWVVDSGEPPSPLGPLFANEAPEVGPYHGYHYRILKSQGEHAEGGAYDYLVGGRMIAGFALIAWPAVYGQTGVMSFMVNHDGIVYEQNLGPDSSEVAKRMNHFDPDSEWKPVQEVNTAQATQEKD